MNCFAALHSLMLSGDFFTQLRSGIFKIALGHNRFKRNRGFLSAEFR